MTLKSSGAISFADVNAEIGVSTSSNLSLSWIRSNSYYQYTGLSSLYGKAYFAAKSSQNSVSRSTTAVTTNCSYACASQVNASGYDGGGGWSNCNLLANVNCNQCSYTHGATMLQPNCNCNCDCWNCNCSYNNCNCNCDCQCTCDCTNCSSW